MEQFGALGQFMPLLLIIVVFYFFMLRPQQKKIKQEKEFESGLKNGDKVVTKSGIHGRIAELTETAVIIETMAGKIKFERSAISAELTQKVNQPAK
ncbi:preprotein translocase subunit YajC [Flavobacterium sp. Sd200]|uniref:preprotein translocase subunit YajC n=1 Tax=Flavobacterium sp. Sd200 TaxID=2692211 RepID=UPI00136A7D46|nr:preprotein translocase subunit YajC [Flavobacterium sp. Sd200]MXN90040.1 preprotein translocase subunit YajC [Flavobacterium sp. Sd200]